MTKREEVMKRERREKRRRKRRDEEGGNEERGQRERKEGFECKVYPLFHAKREGERRKEGCGSKKRERARKRL